MASKPPRFLTSDGDLTTELIKVSSMKKQIIEGEIADDVVDMQINFNGSGFQSNPDLIEFEQGSFTIPNQQVLPDGLELQYGQNVIEVRSIHSTGLVSNISRAEIDVVKEDEIDLLVQRPSGLRVRRKQNAVEVVWASNEGEGLNTKGYHVYASSQAGGGTEGYRRINRDLITEPSFSEEEESEVATNEVVYQGNQGVLHQRFTEEDFDGEEIQTVANSFLDTSRTVGNVKVSTTVGSIDETEYFSFTHDRSATQGDGVINNEFFSEVPESEPLFYVITAVVDNPATGEELESPYSEELIGLPLEVTTTLSEPPRRDRFEVAEDYIDSVNRFDEEISLIPGSVSRDLFIEPFSSEAQRMYFLADFIRRSQSFPTLLQIDDNPAYKDALESALGLGPNSQIQNLIDDSFDKLASNVNVTRKESTPAIGDVVFYTEQEPESDLIVPEGTLVSTSQTDGETITFRVTSRQVLPADNADSFFNVGRERWEVTARVQAEEPGEVGNVSAGTITSIVGGGASGFQVENVEALRFGQDEEDNQSLAERAMLAISSVDAGTKQGYLSTALEQPGVLNAEVVEAGNDLMMRDYDPVREEHIGGKVDVWIQGENFLSVEDTFTLNFETKENVQFFLDSKPNQLVFGTNDNEITPDQPITDLLGETQSERNQGFSFRNSTTGQEFDLTNHQILDYNRIQLDTSLNQPQAGVNDVFTGDVRFVRETDFVFNNQPVREVNTVRSVDDSSEVLEEGTHYNLVKREDPLLRGRSSLASDFLDITQSGGIPSGQSFVINDEEHVFIGEERVSLNKVGIQESTIRVFKNDRSMEYDGPNAGTPDFFVEQGDSTTPTRIYRNPAGDIENGEEVSVDYTYDENYVVDYTVNNLLNEVQAEIEEQRHVTADVVVKETLPYEVSAEMTVVLKSGASTSNVDSKIKTQVSQVVNSLGVGEDLHQSDIVQAVEEVGGVSHVVMPLTELTLNEDNLIVREDLDNVATFLENVANRDIYLLREGLNYATTPGGGTDLRHQGVFQDTQSLELVGNYNEIRRAAGRAVIIGNQGLVIPDFTDEKTLRSQKLGTSEEIEEERRRLTANHIMVSVKDSDTPLNHEYSVSYLTTEENKSRSSIDSSSIAHIELGEISITYTKE